MSTEPSSASDLFAALRGGDFLAAIRVLKYIEVVAYAAGEKCSPTLGAVRGVKDLVETMHITRLETRKECRDALRAANEPRAADREP